MEFPKNGGWLIGAGFLLGTVGVKALTSKTAKRCYVQGMVKGLEAKAAYENVVEKAKAEFDDMAAEANYISVQNSAKPADDAEGASEKSAE